MRWRRESSNIVEILDIHDNHYVSPFEELIR